MFVPSRYRPETPSGVEPWGGRLNFLSLGVATSHEIQIALIFCRFAAGQARYAKNPRLTRRAADSYRQGSNGGDRGAVHRRNQAIYLWSKE